MVITIYRLYFLWILIKPSFYHIRLCFCWRRDVSRGGESRLQWDAFKSSFNIYGWFSGALWAGRTEKTWSRRAVGPHTSEGQSVCGQRKDDWLVEGPSWHSHFNPLPPPCGRAETLQLRLNFLIYVLLLNKQEMMSVRLMFTSIGVMLVTPAISWL